MTFWYNAPKGDSKYAQLNCSDYANTDASFKFKAVKFILSDERITFYGLAESADDVKKSKTDDFKLENQLITFDVHLKSYTKRKLTDGKWSDVVVQPTRAEEAIAKALKLRALSPDKEYEGTIRMGLSISEERMLLDGTKANGQPASQEMITDTSEGILLLWESGSNTLTVVPSNDDKKGNWSGGGSKGQAESERLEERWQFFRKQMAPYSDDSESVAQFARRLKSMEASEVLIVESALRSLALLMK